MARRRRGKIKKADGVKEPLELHRKFLQKNHEKSYFPIDSCCQPCLVQAFFLLIAWNGSMLLFWCRSGKRTRSLLSFPLNGWDCSLLFWLALLYSPSAFYLDKIFQVQIHFYFCPLDKIFLSPISLLFSVGTKLF